MTNEEVGGWLVTLTVVLILSLWGGYNWGRYHSRVDAVKRGHGRWLRLANGETFVWESEWDAIRSAPPHWKPEK